MCGSIAIASLVSSTSSAWKLQVRHTSPLPVTSRASVARTASSLVFTSAAISATPITDPPLLEK